MKNKKNILIGLLFFMVFLNIFIYSVREIGKKPQYKTKILYLYKEENPQLTSELVKIVADKKLSEHYIVQIIGPKNKNYNYYKDYYKLDNEGYIFLLKSNGSIIKKYSPTIDSLNEILK